ncbi:O-methyltransferase COMT-type, S-adenosyl-L-methionine-dependent methyltransferase [Artemisia annua]|uniref:O-methyltransferase COMT-type, S-adenosyl-L-methionine-dependent methyltransferase n=1 Tax=Artemisia annua TaxID=35608 RepID=A0A2U1MX39_ARTAN|nr:O-methyltransferase COMT-type, S-adenosyl-L-methionine-dependent methyltransferase [Artemisia annua]
MDTNIEDAENQLYTYALQIVTSIALPMVLSNAIKLKVLEVIAEAGPDAQLSAYEIALRLSISNHEAPDMIDRMLRLLASYSIVTCIQQDCESKPVRVYGLAPVAKLFIKNEDGVSLGPMLELHQNKLNIDTWFKLKESVHEGGIAFEKIHGMHEYEYLGLNAELNEVFNNAMVETSTIVVKKMLKNYHGFKNIECMVDVGGGFGTTLSMIVSKYPTIKGINMDLPHVIQHAPLYTGITHVEGDMFDKIPHADGILMKWVLHCYDDDRCVKLLKNCYTALQDGGKVIIVEKILPFLPDTSSSVKTGSHLDAIMMTQTPGGKERTEAQFLALAKEAGFVGLQKQCFVCNYWVMEIYK